MTMATSLLSPLVAPNPELAHPSTGLQHKSSFLPSTNLFLLSNPRNQRVLQQQRCCYYKSPSASGNSLNHIPTQFREENLKDG
ncbi:hypothetical protein OIU78_008401, partial [Salix suchowensis]